MAQGVSQRYGVDFDDKFALVCLFAVLRCFLAIYAIRPLEFRRLDAKVAFPNATLDEEVYAHLPDVYHATIPRSVRPLYKALYGLRQTPRA